MGFKEIRRLTKTQQCLLREEEKHKLAIELAGEEGRLGAAEQAKDEAAKSHKAAIAAIEARIDELAIAVNQGWMYRPVEVVEWADWENKRVFQTRIDTAEMIDERPMTNEERAADRPLDL